MHDLPSTVNALELAWTIYTAIGAIISVWLAADVIRDINDRDLMRDNATRRAAARLCIAITSTMVISMLTFVAIGIVAMAQPQPPGPANSAGQIAATIGFCLVATCMVAVAIYWRIVRFRARRDGHTATDLPVMTGGSRDCA